MNTLKKLQRSYALICKGESVLLYEGEIKQLNCLEELKSLQQTTDNDIIFLNPFCAIRERGFEARGDDPIKVLINTQKSVHSKSEFIASSSNQRIELDSEITPSVSDKEFANIVAQIQQEEISGGNAAQVIFSRDFNVSLKNFSESIIHELFFKLLQTTGQYMTFCFADKSQENPNHHSYVVGASPERHLEINTEETIMMPIAGSYHKSTQENFDKEINDFINDPKEINELLQVLDEELKMMACICPKGGTIQGPLLREIGAVIHTEYKLTGIRSHLHPIDALRYTMHAPTLVGGPLESAARIITKYETQSRGYYGGEIGILRKDNTLDSAILIRTAYISGKGQVRVPAGAGIVEASNPETETRETLAKATGTLNILKGQSKQTGTFLDALTEKTLQPKLEERNKSLSTFHFDNQSNLDVSKRLNGIAVTIINNEDNFAYILEHMIIHLGGSCKVVDTFEFDADNDQASIYLIGPGPGDINDDANKRMILLRNIVKELYEANKPMLGICLGHQTITRHIGCKIEKQKQSTQGIQRLERIFNSSEKLGFYNSFSPTLDADLPKGFEAFYDDKKRIIAIQGPNIVSCQFHPESSMTERGYEILKECLHSIHTNTPVTLK